MDADRRNEVAAIVIALGLAAIVTGGVIVSLDNNTSPPPADFSALVAIELCAGGAAMTVAGFAALTRHTAGMQRIAAQSFGIVLGAGLFLGLIWGEAQDPVPGTSLLTLYAATPVIFGGLGILLVSLGSVMSSRNDTPKGAITGSGGPIPPQSQFCPFCGLAMSTEFKYCRRCGKPVGT